MLTSIRKIVFTFALLTATTSIAFSQAVVTIDQKKDACNGLANGSVRITVTSGVGPFSYFFIGLDNFSGPFTGPLTLGVPFTVTNLPPDTYLLTIPDFDPSPNFGTNVVILNNTSPLGVSVSPGFPINNTDCAFPNGQISITPTGGTGSYSYDWDGPGSFDSNLQNITGLAGGTYQVDVFDNGTNCIVSLGSIVITDPSPSVQTVSTPTPQILCTGLDATISLTTTEGAFVQYEVLNNGNPTGVTAPGTGGPITLFVPFGTVSNGDILTIRATNGVCTPVNMSGAVNLNIVPLPTAVTSGGGTVCASDPLPSVTFTFTGTPPFNFTYTDGISSFPIVGHNALTFTIPNAPAGSYSVTALTDANTCLATSLGGSVPVIVNPLPVPTLSGSLTNCIGSTGVVYTTEAGQSNYVWAVSAGGTITSGGTPTSNTATITWNTTGPQTVSVGYTDINGCPSATPTILNVTVTPLPVPTISGTTPVCAGSTGNVYTTEAGQTNYVWAVSAGGTITAGGTNTDNTVTITWNTASPQTVSVSYTDPSGCSAALPTISNITVNPQPTPTLSGALAVCEGTTGVVYTTEAGQTNYAWSVSAGGTITSGGTPTDNTATITWNTSGPQTVTVNYNNAFGCPAAIPTVLNINVNPLPVPTLGGSITSCTGTTGVIYTTDPGQSNYIWVVSPGGTITSGGTSTSNTATVTWNSAGPQSVSISYTDGNGCSPTTPTVLNVTVNPLPVPALAGPSPLCAGTTGNIYTTDAGQTNYVWTISAGGTITAGGTNTDNTVTITWNTSGPQTVQVNYSIASGCSAVSPTLLNVTINPPPVPTIAGAASSCVGTTGVVYTTEAGQSNYVWSVSGGGTITSGGTATDNTVTVTWTTAGPQTVSVNYLNIAGCTAATPTVTNVAVNALPVPTLSGLASACAGTTGVVYSTEAGQSNYIWVISAGGTVTAGGTSTSNSVTITWTTVGAQSVSVNYTDPSGCAATAPTVNAVTVNPVPTPSLSGTVSLCAGTTGVIYSTDAGQSNYVWTVSAGGTITSGGTSTDNTVTISWITPGPQSVSVNYTNASNCPAPIATALGVTVNPLPVPTLTGSNLVCVGATGVVYSTDPGQTGYIWLVSGGGLITAGGTATDNTVTITWGTAGPQTVSVNYTDINGCSAGIPTLNNITVNALPVPTLAGSISVCEASIGNVYTTDAGQSNYIWTVSAGGTITAGGTPTDNSVTITWTTAGPQTVSINYTNASGCIASTATVSNVTVNGAPTPTLAGSNAECIGTTNVVYTTDAGQSNYVWTVSTGGTITSGGSATDNTVTVTWSTAGPQSVTVNYTDASGCSAATPTSLPVVVNPLPAPTLSGSTAICVGATGVVYTTDAGQSNYVWAVSAGATITSGGTATDNTITITWATSGPQTVSISYTNANGCIAATPTVLNVNVNTTVVPTLTGLAAACVGTTGVVYTTDAGQSNYVWVVSAGGTIASGGTATDNTVTVDWGTSGPQSVSISYTDINGCPVPTPTVLNVAVGTVPNPSLTGSNSECEGATNIIYTTDVGQTNYVWTVSAGGTITAGGTATDNTVTITWTTAGAQNVTINYTSSGCPGAAPTSLSVNVNPLPVPTLSGSATACEGTTGVVYSTEAAQTNYAWTVSAGGTITAGGTATDNTITITWTTAGAQSVSVNYSDANGCSATTPTSLPVTVNTIPVPTITGSASVCAGSTANVYTTEAGQSNYVWLVSGGGTITAGGTATDNTVTITWGAAGPETVSVNYTDASTCSAATPTISNITVNPSPLPTLSGSATVCAGTANVIYTTEAGQTNYAWSVSAGGVITSGGSATDNTVTVTWITAGARSVSVNYTSLGCSAPTPTSLPVTVNALPTATLSGTNSICTGGSSTLTFTLTGVGPWDVIYSDGVTNFPVSFAASPGTVSVSPIVNTTYSLVSVSNAQCGTGTTNGTAIVSVNPIPGDQVTFGTDTWIGYVYTDAASPAPPISNIDYASAKYRGFIDETDITSLGFSSYNTATDVFNLNLSNNVLLMGPNVCGSYLEDYSLRLKMTKTFAAGIYTFTLGGDDGVRFFIDGVLVDLNNPNTFTTHAYTSYTSVSQCLTAGPHDLVIEYFERGGFSRLTFDYQLSTAPTAPTPVAVCVGSAAPTLTVSSTDLSVTGFNWYSDATLTTLVFNGANYTPLAADLDMSVVATSDFFVTAIYACGEGQAAQVIVDVVNGATVTLPTPPAQICQSGGIVNLTTLVSALPPGGNFIFSGTGVTVSPSFDPTLVAGTATITVDYSVGTCVATQQFFDIDVINTATVTVPAADISICQSSGTQDLTLLVSGTPLAGTFTFTGAGVTGTSFDPSAQSGIVPILVDYNVGGPGGCIDSKTFNFNVTNNAVLTVNNSTIVCPSVADIDLRTLVTAVPAGGTFTFTGTGVTGNFFDPTISAGTTVSIDIEYDQGGCTAVSTVQIVVRSAADPACSGGGTNCFAFATSDPVIETRPSCADQDDGQLIFGVKGGTGTYVITLYDSVSTPIFTQAKIGSSATPITFNSLSPSLTYFYKIDDGTNTCTLPYSLPVQTIVTASAASFTDAQCFGQPTGTAIITASGGTSPYEYSVDGINWTSFISGEVLDDLPPNGTYNILVRDDATDLCNSEVLVTINNANPDLQIGITVTDATCNNNDGSILITPPTAPNIGGGGPYMYALSDGMITTPFQASTTFSSLAGGVYSILVQDGTGCVKTITPVNVTFPGFVNFTTTSTPADCTNNGISGLINVDITDIGGVYSVALSTDQFNEPADADYISYSEPSITFPPVARGTYFVYVKSQTASCPTRSAAIPVNGVNAVSFDIVQICENNQVSIILDNLTGATEFGLLRYELYVSRKNNPGVLVTPGGVPALISVDPNISDAIRLDYNDPDYSFLTIPNVEYEISLYQFQTVPSCPITSPIKDYTTTRPLFARAKPRTSSDDGESYADIATGKMSIIDFDGGAIPYEIRIELDSASVDGQSFETDFEEVTNNSNLQFQKDYENIPAGRYLVQVQDLGGCVLEFYERVPLDIDLFVPNIFTPNNDGLNDVFFIRNLPTGEGNLTITDRWGVKVFSTNKYGNNWDGEGLADGVYYYTLQTSTDTRKGWVEILKGVKP